MILLTLFNLGDEGNLINVDLNLKDMSGRLTVRHKAKIIRFRHYQKTSPSEYWREQLMLFVPWRNEEDELDSIDVLEAAEKRKDEIIRNSRQFYNNRELDDRVLGDYIHELEQTQDNFVSDDESINENQEEALEQDAHAESYLTNTKQKSAVTSATILPPKLISDAEYFSIMRSLNENQRKIVMNILHCLKTGKLPFHIFLSGGAGVGKSHVITAIIQSYLRFCNKDKTISPDDICVSVSAPTGKAAFNIKGMTMHSTFRLNPTQSKKYTKLSDSIANSLRLKFRNTKLFIIDEISMVSATQLWMIDQRLKELFDKASAFGGKSILVVGHLRQLRPIGGEYVFQAPRICQNAVFVDRNPLWEMFKFFELDEIMRQRGEREFCNALNHMADGCMDEDDIRLISNREISLTLQPPENAIWLFYTNKDCQEHNHAIHEKLNTDFALSTAFDKVTGMNQH